MHTIGKKIKKLNELKSISHSPIPTFFIYKKSIGKGRDFFDFLKSFPKVIIKYFFLTKRFSDSLFQKNKIKIQPSEIKIYFSETLYWKTEIKSRNIYFESMPISPMEVAFLELISLKDSILK